MTKRWFHDQSPRLGAFGQPFVAAGFMAIAFSAATAEQSPGTRPAGFPSVQEMISARTDLWGDAAMQQPDGASFDFFRGLLPPLRWVNAEFRHYPLMLSAPRGLAKARLISNGSSVNARANNPPMWFEAGTPVTFSVGEPPEPFGQDVSRMEGPKYESGHWPIVRVSYRKAKAVYTLEAFAPVEPELAEQGAILLSFQARGPSPGRIEAQIKTDKPLKVARGEILNEKDDTVAAYDPSWIWQPDRKALGAPLPPGRFVNLAIFTKPGPASGPKTASLYDHHRQTCVRTWRGLLDAGARLTTPESSVNNAWRATLIGNFMIAAGDRMHYSAGNAYAKLYQGECGDALRSLLLFGHIQAARDMLKPLLEFDRQATRFHVAGHKLQLLAWYYWVTRDAESIRAHEPIWRPFLDRILIGREPLTGLLPKDNYAGDISQQVYSLNSNANCWRGLRDVGAMFEEMGRTDEARRLTEEAAIYRQAILDAVRKSERRETTPPFIPVALLADEPAHDPLTATRIGSYYDLIAPYIIGSGIFPPQSDRQTWLLEYLQRHGGIASGMVRTRPDQGPFRGEAGVVPLYGLRYQLALLERDEREKALVGFYGHLALGMTPDTYIGGEGTRFLHGDADGRSLYLPPNSASNAAFLLVLRYLILQDWDFDDDGRPETLRLLYGIPRHWIKNDSTISMEQAPSAFGPVSIAAHSHLLEGHVEVRIALPPRAPHKTLLRIPLPIGWKATGASIDGSVAVMAIDGALDLSGRGGNCSVRIHVAKQ